MRVSVGAFNPQNSERSFTSSFIDRERLEGLRQHFMQMVSSYLHQSETRFGWQLFEAIIAE